MNELHPPRTLALGIDTGGTFTDAVLFDLDAQAVVASAKSPTTHHDLSIGIDGAVRATLVAGGFSAPQSGGRIAFVSLSTTLATNALVEDRGRPVAAVVIGFDVDVLRRAGLAEALRDAPCIHVAGGHDAHGREVVPLDLDGVLAAAADVVAQVDGFAVTSQFSTRNDAHEVAVGAALRDRFGKSVTLSHHLSSQLNGPRRAVTAVLNARLVPIVDDLVTTVRSVLERLGIDAPLSIVRGDGSLVSDRFIRERPIETILSGPAASVVGASFLANRADALVSDIGGTTTDVAVMRHGTPLLDPQGAVVGGHRTMVAALAVRTHGLGGDSLVVHDPRAAGAGLVIGPRRVVPIGRLAVAHPQVTRALQGQAEDMFPAEMAGHFLVLPAHAAGLIEPPQHRALALADASPAESEIGAALASGPVARLDLATSSGRRRAIDNLLRRGEVLLSAFTPSDACAVLGLLDDRAGEFDPAAAGLAATLLAKQRDRLGRPIATDGRSIARLTFERVVRRSAEVILEAACVADDMPIEAVHQVLVQRSLDRSTATVSAAIGVSLPIVALGASAATYYPAVGDLLSTTVVVPEHAGVANAVGAVVGSVRVQRSITVTSPAVDVFLAFGVSEVPFTTLDAARSAADACARQLLAEDLERAGSPDAEVVVEWTTRTALIEGREFVVEATLTATGTGRPAMSGIAAPQG